MSVIAPVRLRVTRIIRATPERLFQAWTDPKQLARWWHLQGEGWTFAEAVIDLREGGAYRLAMTGPDGKVRIAVGEYHEIRRPTRLVFSWHWLIGASRGPDTMVTVQFDPAPGGETEVVLTHERITEEKTRSGFQSGWSQLLFVLKDYLGSENHDH